MSDTTIMLRFPGKHDHLTVYEQIEVKRSAVEYEYVVTEVRYTHDTLKDGLATEVELLRKNAFEERVGSEEDND